MKITEIFYSISGESINAGYPTVFVRTYGCNCRCSYCDSDYSWSGGGYREMSISKILEEVNRYYPCDRVILTGGEPLIQPDWKDLVKVLWDNGYTVEIETNGAVPLDRDIPNGVTYTMDWKSISSGMSDRMVEDNLHNLRPGDSIKFVVGSKEDLDQAKVIIEKILWTGVNIFFSPIFGKIEPKDIVQYILDNKLVKCRMQLQLHKFIWPPEQRGV